jgi:hypothetical protein
MNARPGLLMQVALAALAGGLLAALVLAGVRTIDNKPALVLIVLAAVVFCVLAVARRSPAPPPQATHPYAPAPAPARAPQPAAFTWSQAPATANGYASPHWSAPAPTVDAPPAPEPGLPVATAAVSVRDGSRLPISAAGASRVVQCPRCGEFAVEVGLRAPGFAFRCHCCGHEWRWAPGASWPVSVVRPRAQHQQARSS